MNVDDECELISLRCQKILKCLRFGLREGIWSSKIGIAWILICLFGIHWIALLVQFWPILLLKVHDIINFAKIHAKIPIQIDAAVDIRGLYTPKCTVSVLPFGHNLLGSDPILLNECRSIDIEYWHEVIRVLRQ